MATETTKVLAQAAPAATTLTDFYTVPGATATVFSTVTVCNQNAASIKFRISVAVAGAADAAKQYLYYDSVLVANGSVTLTLGITLAATDVMRIYADTTNVSFNAFGVEVT